MKITVANIEVSTFCNAHCPLCVRNRYEDKITLPNLNLDLDKFKALDWATSDIERLKLCGSFGDPILHPHLFDLIDIINDLGYPFTIFTNGEPHSEMFWAALAERLKGNKVMFGLDGIDKKTHEIYRGTNFERVIRNIKAFTDNGGIGRGQFITFKHNEHQIVLIEDFNKSLGLPYTEIYKSRSYNDNLKETSEDVQRYTRCFAVDGEVSMDVNARLFICCNSWIRTFFNENSDWNLKTAKPYNTFDAIGKSVYYKYAGEMDFCKVCDRSQHPTI